MTDRQLAQLSDVASIESSIMDRIFSIKESIANLSSHIGPICTDGDEAENTFHKEEVISSLSRIINNANTLAHPAVVLRAKISQGQ